MKRHFECPYAKKPLTKPCDVGSCNFNLPANSKISKLYNRCFLNYSENLSNSSSNSGSLEQNEFPRLSEEKRQTITKYLFNATDTEINRSKSSFYFSLFSILSQDIVFTLSKSELDPIPFKQCVVCGSESDNLWYPKNGVLPSGHGYCSWNCFQLKTPPILLMEKLLDVEYEDLSRNMEFDSLRSRTKFVRYLLQKVLGDVPLM